MKLSQFTAEQLEKIRYHARTDLFFLGHDIFEKRFTEFTHRKVCDFFVVKNPSFKTFRGFAQQYTLPHDRLLILPRKSYKSTIKVLDNVQWQICWPDIRIIALTATKRLATAFIDEFQSYFVVKDGIREDHRVVGGEPTFFQQLFPEFSITQNELSVEFISPARKTYFKEPTIGALSMESAGAGWACDIIDFDDCINEKNTKTGMRLEELGESLALYSKLKMNYGFRHIVGTRYNPSDPYGMHTESHGITEVYGDYETPELKYMGRPCWWLKGQPWKQPDYKTWIPNEADLDLFFPEDLPFRFLAKELKEQPETFFSQELNDPIEASNVQFTEDMVRACFIDHTALPKSGNVYAAWDLAYSTHRKADFTVGAVGLLDDHGEWWILDIIRGHFDWTETPYQIANAIRIHHLKRTCIEDALGAKQMTESLDRHGREMNVVLDIDWLSLGRGTDDAKLLRMMTLHPWIREHRIHFLNTINCVDDLLKEFRNIGNERARNDIPDAISRLVQQYSALAKMLSLPSDEQKLRDWHELARDEMRQLIFGQGKYGEEGPERERLLMGRDGKFWRPNQRAPEPEGYTDSMTGLPSPYPI